MATTQAIIDAFEGKTFQNKSNDFQHAPSTADIITVDDIRHPTEDEPDALIFHVKPADLAAGDTFTQFEVQERIQDGRWIPVEDV